MRGRCLLGGGTGVGGELLLMDWPVPFSKFFWVLWLWAFSAAELHHSWVNCSVGWFSDLLTISKRYYINGHHKQYIQVDIICNCMFHFGLPGTCFYKSHYNTPSDPASERCISRTFIKTCSWKSEMKHVVKYNAYLEILFMVSIYEINIKQIKESRKSKHLAFISNLYYN